MPTPGHASGGGCELAAADPLRDLNPEQRAAAEFGDGPLLVIAGAGTGKTRALAARVAKLVERGVPAERILLLTFSRRAAREMLSRVQRSGKERVLGGTFHAVAHRLLRIYAEPMGLTPGFTVLDRGDAEDLMDLVREELGLRSGGDPRRARRFPRKATCLAIYSRCVNAAERLEDVLRERFPWVSEHAGALRGLFRAYEERKLSRAVLDLDDLLVWLGALCEDARLGPAVEARFDHVLVDEYQDTNRIQRAILLALRRTNKNITVVGDDAQAIYAFRAATVRNILEFEGDFPGARVVRLERNYRSSAPILEVSNAVIALARDRREKTLRPAVERGGAELRPVLIRSRDELDEADLVIRSALARLEEGVPLRRQAVLFRTAHHSDILEVELSRRKIPFRKFGGLRFLDAAHVKDLVAVLRIAENPGDETAWFRVLKLLDGVGPATARRVLGCLAASGYALGALDGVEVPPPARASVRALADCLRSLDGPVDGGDRDARPTVRLMVERARRFLDPIITARYDAPAARVRDLDALGQLSAEASSRRDLLAELALDPPSATGDLAADPHLDEDWLVLSTIHSAKGLEWDAVTVIRAVDGSIPSDLATGSVEEIEEERRLLYVAMTRARRHLTVIAPLRLHNPDRPRSDRHVYAPLTRFLTEPILRLFDHPLEAPAAPGATAQACLAPGAAEALRAKIRGRWG